MQRIVLKSKIHRATVTDANLNYEGSITIDEGFSTYVIKGKKGSGVICLNGAAARKVSKGDLVIIASYVMVEDAESKGWSPKCVHVDAKNRVKK